MARNFNQNNSEYIQFDPGNAAATGTGGAFAYGVIWRAYVPTLSGGMGLIRGFDSGGTEVWGANPYSDDNVYFADGGFVVATHYARFVWMFTLVVMGAGNSTPRTHHYSYGDSSWTHANGGSSLTNDRNPAVRFRLCHFDGLQFLHGDLAVTGIFGNLTSLSDGAIEAAGFHTNLSAWVAKSPLALWKFDLPVATTVVDVTGGGANQNDISGTSYSSDDPPGFSYSLSATFDPRKAAAIMAWV